MEIVIESSKTVKPADNGGGHVWAPDVVLLTAFDELQHDEYMSSIHAFHPPAPSNTILEAGLATALAEHREWAGRLGVDHSTGRRAIFLNDTGARFIEAKAEFPLATIMPLLPGTPVVQRLHPSWDNNGAGELMLVQVTRFSCGSFVVGHAMHHSVGDGIAMVHCLLAWGQATRGIAIEPVPVHDRNSFFDPRNPLRIEFQHRGTEFRAQDERNNMLCGADDDDARNNDEVVTHKVSFSKEFILDLKSRVCEGMPRPYTMVQCLVAHLWRCVTKARGLPSGVATTLHIAVNGRARMRQPQVPQGYTGNVLLWAHPTATARELLAGPLGHVSELIRREVARIDDSYFRSFIDFVSSGAVKQEGLVSMADTAECQDCAVYCIQRIPFYELDFGGGQQFLYMPNYHPVDGLIYILPSSPLGDGSVEAQVSLPSHVMDAFKDLLHMAVPYIQSNI